MAIQDLEEESNYGRRKLQQTVYLQENDRIAQEYKIFDSLEVTLYRENEINDESDDTDL